MQQVKVQKSLVSSLEMPKLSHYFIPISQCREYSPFPVGIISSLNLDVFQILSALRNDNTAKEKKNLPLTHTENNSFLYLWDPCSQTLERLTPRPEQIPQLTNLPPATHPHLIEDSLSSQDIVSFLRVFFCVFQCPLGLSRSRQSHHQNHLQVNSTRNAMKNK